MSVKSEFGKQPQVCPEVAVMYFLQAAENAARSCELPVHLKTMVTVQKNDSRGAHALQLGAIRAESVAHGLAVLLRDDRIDGGGRPRVGLVATPAALVAPDNVGVHLLPEQLRRVRLRQA